MGNIRKLLENKTEFKALSYIIKKRNTEKSLERNWSKIVGKLESDLSLRYVKNTHLYIQTNNPIWITEIAFYQQKILSTIHKILNTDKINKIKVIYDPKLNIKEKKKEKKKFPKRSLEQQIKDEINRKKETGFIECRSCKTWHKRTGLCVFCS